MYDCRTSVGPTLKAWVSMPRLELDDWRLLRTERESTVRNMFDSTMHRGRDQEAHGNGEHRLPSVKLVASERCRARV
jgi:hypothetical protein